jgi:hypothetical protein
MKLVVRGVRYIVTKVLIKLINANRRDSFILKLVVRVLRYIAKLVLTKYINEMEIKPDNVFVKLVERCLHWNVSLVKFKEMQTNRITLLQRYLVLISSPMNYTQPDNVIATLFLIKLINEMQTNLTMLLWNLL